MPPKRVSYPPFLPTIRFLFLVFLCVWFRKTINDYVTGDGCMICMRCLNHMYKRGFAIKLDGQREAITEGLKASHCERWMRTELKALFHTEITNHQSRASFDKHSQNIPHRPKAIKLEYCAIVGSVSNFQILLWQHQKRKVDEKILLHKS